jgi:predicted homoserine dehydrogenase-like protein
MDRRSFLKTSAAGLALSATGRYAAAFADQKPLRVGLIGCGWYGKSDIFRLVQVAPVEIVSLCDVDKKMLADCAEMASQRQAS